MGRPAAVFILVLQYEGSFHFDGHTGVKRRPGRVAALLSMSNWRDWVADADTVEATLRAPSAGSAPSPAAASAEPQTQEERDAAKAAWIAKLMKGDDEEMGEFDPFSDENVPSPKRRNNGAIRDLFKRRFKKDAPIRATFQSRLFGELLGYLRACIIRNVYPIYKVLWML